MHVVAIAPCSLTELPMKLPESTDAEAECAAAETFRPLTVNSTPWSDEDTVPIDLECGAPSLDDTAGVRDTGDAPVAEMPKAESLKVAAEAGIRLNTTAAIAPPAMTAPPAVSAVLLDFCITSASLRGWAGRCSGRACDTRY